MTTTQNEKFTVYLLGSDEHNSGDWMPVHRADCKCREMNLARKVVAGFNGEKPLTADEFAKVYGCEYESRYQVALFECCDYVSDNNADYKRADCAEYEDYMRYLSFRPCLKAMPEHVDGDNVEDKDDDGEPVIVRNPVIKYLVTLSDGTTINASAPSSVPVANVKALCKSEGYKVASIAAQ